MTPNNLTLDEVFEDVDLFINATKRYPTSEDQDEMWKHLTSIIDFVYTSKQPEEIFKQIVTYEKEKNQIRYEILLL